MQQSELLNTDTSIIYILQFYHDAIRIAILESPYDTYHNISLMLRLIDYQAKIKVA